MSESVQEHDKLIFRILERDEIPQILPLLQVLDPSVPEPMLRERLQAMLETDYECVGIFDGDRLIGVSGLWILTKYYVGKHIEPDNVVILPEYRGGGIGRRLMEWIYEYGRSQGCVASELNCYVDNEAGKRFWESEGYELIGLHLRRRL